MIRYCVIILLVGYSFHLRLELSKKANSFGHLTRTCNATQKFAEEIGKKCTIKERMNSKLAFISKNNEKLLYNYRTCVSQLDEALGRIRDKVWLANLSDQ